MTPFTRSALALIPALLMMTMAPVASASETTTKSWYGVKSEDLRLNMGADLGVSAVNEGVGTGAAFGIHGSWFVLPNIGMSLGASAANHDNNRTTYFLYGEGLFRFSSAFPNYTLGLMVGSGKLSSTSVPEDFTFAIGPKFAVDFPISREVPVTLGVDVAVLFFDAPIATGGGDTTLRVIRPSLTAKFWF